MNLFLIFALGTGTMLSLPIFLAICVAYYQRQSSMLPLGTHQLVPGQDVISTADCDWDDEEGGGSDRVRGATRGSARPRGGRRLMKVYFRTSDWCSHGQPPLMVKLDLEDVCSVAVCPLFAPPRPLFAPPLPTPHQPTPPQPTPPQPTPCATPTLYMPTRVSRLYAVRCTPCLLCVATLPCRSSALDYATSTARRWLSVRAATRARSQSSTAIARGR